MIKPRQVVPGFLEACPGLRVGWDERLRPEDVCGDAPTDIGYIGDYLANCYRRGDFAEFPAAFAFLERCFVEGTKQTQRDCVFVLYPLQLILRRQPGDSEAFGRSWLGPYSRAGLEFCETLAEKFMRFFAENPIPGMKEWHPPK